MNLLLKKSFILFNCWIAFGPLACFSVFGQSRYEILTTADGLSQGMVFALLQDREGFIWMATKDGLNRYDGYEFKVFTNDPYNNQSLSSNTITRLFEDSKGRIWAGAENAGLNIYDKKKGAFYRIENSTTNSKSISGNNISAIVELPDGRMLIATDVKGLDIIELPDEYFSSTELPLITRLNLPGNIQVYGMGKDKNKRIFIGGMDGSVYTFDDKKLSFVVVPNGKLYNNGYMNKDSSVVINNIFIWISL